MIWLTLALLVVASIEDLRFREVSDGYSIVLLITAILGTAFHWHEVSWIGLLGGFAVGFALSGAFFFLGGLGGADVKLTAALGAILGIQRVFPVLFWIAMAGGVLCLIALLRGKRDIAYVPAISLGLLFFLVSRGNFAWS